MIRQIGLALVVLIAAAGVGYRVFAPAETVSEATAPYPQARVTPPGIAAELPRTPLVVDGRLRVYAAKRQVWADAPVPSRTETTPFWSLRRWPHQVVGVVAVPGPLVVSRWSDGTLVATDARTGRVRWRADGTPPEHAYQGRRTGGTTVLHPEALLTGVASDGRTVLVSLSRGRIDGYDGGSGAALWSVARPCPAAGFTGPGSYAELVDCSGAPVLRRLDLGTGRALPDWVPPGVAAPWRVEPVSCAAGRSGCAALRAAGQGFLLDATGTEGQPAELVRAPALDVDGSWLLGQLVIGAAAPARELTARSVRDGAPLWTWRQLAGGNDPGPARVVAVEPGAIYLMTTAHVLVVVNPEGGLELARFALRRQGAEPGAPWEAGLVRVRDRLVVVERLRPGGDPAGSDTGYYAGLRPVLLAGS